MSYKTVYQLSDAGYLIGYAVAQESPLEPGVFLIPRGAIEEAPPSFDVTSQRVRYVAGAWTVEDIVVDVPPAPTVEQLKRELTLAVQVHMNKTAGTLGYDSIYTAVTYADEPAVPKYQAEGRALRAWRSLVWAKCYEVMAAVEAGSRGIPTAEELIAELPAFVAP